MIGKIISQYRILAEIGRGTMGIVFKAEDTALGRFAALKIIAEKLVKDPHMLHRFERETAAASALDHPNICTVYHSGEWQGRPYLAMELLTGHTLDERRTAGPLPLPTLRDVAIGTARALEATSAIGVIHRDIKPANLFLTADGQVKVLDFGLAKVRVPQKQLPPDAPTASMYVTSRGMIVGTLPYMSPEQVRCEALDTRSDLYSLGVVLYELATGELPVHGLPKTAAALAPGFRQLVMKLMAPDIRQRYQTAREAREAFERWTLSRASFEHSAL
jgi:serine/threonine protein kinase